MTSGFEQALSDIASKVLGARVRISEQGRKRDGRFSFSSSKKSNCVGCSVLFLKEHVHSDSDYPCKHKSDRKHCRTYALAQVLIAFGSAKAVENKIEAALRLIRIPAEVSLGRGSAHNLSIIIKVAEADKANFQAAKRKARGEQKLSAALGAALDVLNPPATV
jgi:hypothetical protein